MLQAVLHTATRGWEARKMNNKNNTFFFLNNLWLFPELQPILI